MKEVNEDVKRRIADLYQNTTMSAGAIAFALKVSRDTVLKYKNYWVPQKRL